MAVVNGSGSRTTGWTLAMSTARISGNDETTSFMEDALDGPAR